MKLLSPGYFTITRAINTFVRIGFTKTVAVITATSFLFTTVLSPAAQAVIANLPVEHPPFVQHDDLIPYTAGRITEAKYYDGSDTVVINIQDLHCHGEVQRNIARIIESLDRNYNLPSVHVEGGVGEIDTSWASLIPEPGQREKMLGILLDSGRLTGAEYYSIRAGKNNLLLGLENDKPYHENLDRLRRITEARERTATLLPQLRQHIALLKKRYFSPRNQRLETLIAKENSGEEYYRSLVRYARKAGVDLYEYPAITDYLAVIQMRKRLNHKRISRELSDCLSFLKTRLPYGAYRELSEKTDHFSRADDLCVQLLLLTQERNIPLGTKFPALGKYFTLIETIRRINPIELVREERQLTRELRSLCTESGAEKEVVFMAGYIEYLEDYFDGRIAADNYRYFTGNSTRFVSLWKKYVSLDEVPELEPENGLLRDFYRVNLDRNGYFLQNLFAAAPAVCGTSEYRGTDQRQKVLESLDSAHIATVVTGGFHTPGFLALLREKKISYLVITPSVTSDTSFSDKAYDRIALEQGETIPAQTIALANYSQELLNRHEAQQQNNVAAANEALERMKLARDTLEGNLQLILHETGNPAAAAAAVTRTSKELGFDAEVTYKKADDSRPGKYLFDYVYRDKGRSVELKLTFDRAENSPGRGMHISLSRLLSTAPATLLTAVFIAILFLSGYHHAFPVPASLQASAVAMSLLITGESPLHLSAREPQSQPQPRLSLSELRAHIQYLTEPEKAELIASTAETPNTTNYKIVLPVLKILKAPPEIMKDTAFRMLQIDWMGAKATGLRYLESRNIKDERMITAAKQLLKSGEARFKTAGIITLERIGNPDDKGLIDMITEQLADTEMYPAVFGALSTLSKEKKLTLNDRQRQLLASATLYVITPEVYLTYPWRSKKQRSSLDAVLPLLVRGDTADEELITAFGRFATAPEFSEDIDAQERAVDALKTIRAAREHPIEGRSALTTASPAARTRTNHAKTWRIKLKKPGSMSNALSILFPVAAITFFALNGPSHIAIPALSTGIHANAAAFLPDFSASITRYWYAIMLLLSIVPGYVHIDDYTEPALTDGEVEATINEIPLADREFFLNLHQRLTNAKLSESSRSALITALVKMSTRYNFIYVFDVLLLLNAPRTEKLTAAFKMLEELPKGIDREAHMSIRSGKFDHKAEAGMRSIYMIRTVIESYEDMFTMGIVSREQRDGVISSVVDQVNEENYQDIFALLSDLQATDQEKETLAVNLLETNWYENKLAGLEELYRRGIYHSDRANMKRAETEVLGWSSVPLLNRFLLLARKGILPPHVAFNLFEQIKQNVNSYTYKIMTEIVLALETNKLITGKEIKRYYLHLMKLDWPGAKATGLIRMEEILDKELIEALADNQDYKPVSGITTDGEKMLELGITNKDDVLLMRKTAKELLKATERNTRATGLHSLQKFGNEEDIPEITAQLDRQAMIFPVLITLRNLSRDGINVPRSALVTNALIAALNAQPYEEYPEGTKKLFAEMLPFAGETDDVAAANALDAILNSDNARSYTEQERLLLDALTPLISSRKSQRSSPQNNGPDDAFFRNFTTSWLQNPRNTPGRTALLSALTERISREDPHSLRELLITFFAHLGISSESEDSKEIAAAFTARLSTSDPAFLAWFEKLPETEKSEALRGLTRLNLINEDMRPSILELLDSSNPTDISSALSAIEKIATRKDMKLIENLFDRADRITDAKARTSFIFTVLNRLLILQRQKGFAFDKERVTNAAMKMDYAELSKNQRKALEGFKAEFPELDLRNEKPPLNKTLAIVLFAVAGIAAALNGNLTADILFGTMHSVHANAAAFLPHLSFAHVPQKISDLAYFMILPFFAMGFWVAENKGNEKSLISDTTAAGWINDIWIKRNDQQFFIDMHRQLLDYSGVPEEKQQRLIRELVSSSNASNFVFLYDMLLKLGADDQQLQEAVFNMLPDANNPPTIPVSTQDEIGLRSIAMLRTAALFFNDLFVLELISEQHRNQIINDLVVKTKTEPDKYFEIFSVLRELNATSSEQIAFAFYLLHDFYIESKLIGLEELHRINYTESDFYKEYRAIPSLKLFYFKHTISYPDIEQAEKKLCEFTVLILRLAENKTLPDSTRKYLLDNMKRNLSASNYTSMLNLVKALGNEHDYADYALEFLDTNKFADINPAMLAKLEDALRNYLKAEFKDKDRNLTPGMRFIDLNILDNGELSRIREAIKTHLLSSDEGKKRIAGLKALQVFGMQDDVSDVIDQLNYDDMSIPVFITLRNFQQDNISIPDREVLATRFLETFDVSTYDISSRDKRQFMESVLSFVKLSPEQTVKFFSNFITIEDNPDVHAMAIRALSDTGDDTAVAPLKRFLAKASSASNAYNSFLALNRIDENFLGSIGNQNLVIDVFGPYARKSADTHDKFLAIDALQQIKSRDSIDALAQFLVKENAFPVIRDAYHAIKKLEDQRIQLLSYTIEAERIIKERLVSLSSHHRSTPEDSKQYDELSTELLSEKENLLQSRVPGPSMPSSNTRRRSPTVYSVISDIAAGKRGFARDFGVVWTQSTTSTEQRDALIVALIDKLPFIDAGFVNDLVVILSKTPLSRENKDRLMNEISLLAKNTESPYLLSLLTNRVENYESSTYSNNSAAVDYMIETISGGETGFADKFHRLWKARFTTLEQRNRMLLALVKRFPSASDPFLQDFSKLWKEPLFSNDYRESIRHEISAMKGSAVADKLREIVKIVPGRDDLLAIAFLIVGAMLALLNGPLTPASVSAVHAQAAGFFSPLAFTQVQQMLHLHLPSFDLNFLWFLPVLGMIKTIGNDQSSDDHSSHVTDLIEQIREGGSFSSDIEALSRPPALSQQQQELSQQQHEALVSALVSRIPKADYAFFRELNRVFKMRSAFFSSDDKNRIFTELMNPQTITEENYEERDSFLTEVSAPADVRKSVARSLLERNTSKVTTKATEKDAEAVKLATKTLGELGDLGDKKNPKAQGIVPLIIAELNKPKFDGLVRAGQIDYIMTIFQALKNLKLKGFEIPDHPFVLHAMRLLAKEDAFMSLYPGQHLIFYELFTPRFASDNTLMQALINLLKSNDNAVQANSARLLGKSGYKKAIRPLEELLSSSDKPRARVVYETYLALVQLNPGSSGNYYAQALHLFRSPEMLVPAISMLQHRIGAVEAELSRKTGTDEAQLRATLKDLRSFLITLNNQRSPQNKSAGSSRTSSSKVSDKNRAAFAFGEQGTLLLLLGPLAALLFLSLYAMDHFSSLQLMHAYASLALAPMIIIADGRKPVVSGDQVSKWIEGIPNADRQFFLQLAGKIGNSQLTDEDRPRLIEALVEMSTRYNFVYLYDVLLKLNAPYKDRLNAVFNMLGPIPDTIAVNINSHMAIRFDHIDPDDERQRYGIHMLGIVAETFDRAAASQEHRDAVIEGVVKSIDGKNYQDIYTILSGLKATPDERKELALNLLKEFSGDLQVVGLEELYRMKITGTPEVLKAEKALLRSANANVYERFRSMAAEGILPAKTADDLLSAMKRDLNSFNYTSILRTVRALADNGEYASVTREDYRSIAYRLLELDRIDETALIEFEGFLGERKKELLDDKTRIVSSGAGPGTVLLELGLLDNAGLNRIRTVGKTLLRKPKSRKSGLIVLEKFGSTEDLDDIIALMEDRSMVFPVLIALRNLAANGTVIPASNLLIDRILEQSTPDRFEKLTNRQRLLIEEVLPLARLSALPGREKTGISKKFLRILSDMSTSHEYISFPSAHIVLSVLQSIDSGFLNDPANQRMAVAVFGKRYAGKVRDTGAQLALIDILRQIASDESIDALSKFLIKDNPAVVVYQTYLAIKHLDNRRSDLPAFNDMARRAIEGNPGNEPAEAGKILQALATDAAEIQSMEQPLLPTVNSVIAGIVTETAGFARPFNIAWTASKTTDAQRKQLLNTLAKTAPGDEQFMNEFTELWKKPLFSLKARAMLIEKILNSTNDSNYDYIYAALMKLENLDKVLSSIGSAPSGTETVASVIADVSKFDGGNFADKFSTVWKADGTTNAQKKLMLLALMKRLPTARDEFVRNLAELWTGVFSKEQQIRETIREEIAKTVKNPKNTAKYQKALKTDIPVAAVAIRKLQDAAPSPATEPAVAHAPVKKNAAKAMSGVPPEVQALAQRVSTTTDSTTFREFIALWSKNARYMPGRNALMSALLQRISSENLQPREMLIGLISKIEMSPEERESVAKAFAGRLPIDADFSSWVGSLSESDKAGALGGLASLGLANEEMHPIIVESFDSQDPAVIFAALKAFVLLHDKSFAGDDDTRASAAAAALKLLEPGHYQTLTRKQQEDVEKLLPSLDIPKEKLSSLLNALLTTKNKDIRKSAEKLLKTANWRHDLFAIAFFAFGALFALLNGPLTPASVSAVHAQTAGFFSPLVFTQVQQMIHQHLASFDLNFLWFLPVLGMATSFDDMFGSFREYTTEQVQTVQKKRKKTPPGVFKFPKQYSRTLYTRNLLEQLLNSGLDGWNDVFDKLVELKEKAVPSEDARQFLDFIQRHYKEIRFPAILRVLEILDAPDDQKRTIAFSMLSSQSEITVYNALVELLKGPLPFDRDLQLFKAALNLLSSENALHRKIAAEALLETNNETVIRDFTDLLKKPQTKAIILSVYTNQMQKGRQPKLLSILKETLSADLPDASTLKTMSRDDILSLKPAFGNVIASYAALTVLDPSNEEAYRKQATGIAQWKLNTIRELQKTTPSDTRLHELEVTYETAVSKLQQKQNATNGIEALLKKAQDKRTHADAFKKLSLVADPAARVRIVRRIQGNPSGFIFDDNDSDVFSVLEHLGASRDAMADIAFNLLAKKNKVAVRTALTQLLKMGYRTPSMLETAMVFLESKEEGYWQVGVRTLSQIGDASIVRRLIALFNKPGMDSPVFSILKGLNMRDIVSPAVLSLLEPSYYNHVSKPEQDTIDTLLANSDISDTGILNEMQKKINTTDLTSRIRAIKLLNRTKIAGAAAVIEKSVSKDSPIIALQTAYETLTEIDPGSKSHYDELFINLYIAKRDDLRLKKDTGATISAIERINTILRETFGISPEGVGRSTTSIWESKLKKAGFAVTKKERRDAAHSGRSVGTLGTTGQARVEKRQKQTEFLSITIFIFGALAALVSGHLLSHMAAWFSLPDGHLLIPSFDYSGLAAMTVPFFLRGDKSEPGDEIKASHVPEISRSVIELVDAIPQGDGQFFQNLYARWKITEDQLQDVLNVTQELLSAEETSTEDLKDGIKRLQKFGGKAQIEPLMQLLESRKFLGPDILIALARMHERGIGIGSDQRVITAIDAYKDLKLRGEQYAMIFDLLFFTDHPRHILGDDSPAPFSGLHEWMQKNVNPDRAMRLLIKELPETQNNITIITTMRQLGSGKHSKSIAPGTRKDAISAIINAVSPYNAKEIFPTLRALGASPDERARAASAMLQLNDAPATTIALRHLSQRTRTTTQEDTFRRISDSDREMVRAAALELLASSDDGQVRTAVLTLKHIGDKSVIEPLAETLSRNQDTTVRREILETLIHLLDPETGTITIDGRKDTDLVNRLSDALLRALYSDTYRGILAIVDVLPKAQAQNYLLKAIPLIMKLKQEEAHLAAIEKLHGLEKSYKKAVIELLKKFITANYTKRVSAEAYKMLISIDKTQAGRLSARRLNKKRKPAASDSPSVPVAATENLRRAALSPAVSAAEGIARNNRPKQELSISSELRGRSYFRFVRTITRELMDDLDELSSLEMDTFVIAPLSQWNSGYTGEDLKEYGHAVMRSGTTDDYLNLRAVKKGRVSILLFEPADASRTYEDIFAAGDPFAAVAQLVKDNLPLRAKTLGIRRGDFSIDFVEADDDVYRDPAALNAAANDYTALSKTLFFRRNHPAGTLAGEEENSDYDHQLEIRQNTGFIIKAIEDLVTMNVLLELDENVLNDFQKVFAGAPIPVSFQSPKRSHITLGRFQAPETDVSQILAGFEGFLAEKPPQPHIQSGNWNIMPLGRAVVVEAFPAGSFMAYRQLVKTLAQSFGVETSQTLLTLDHYFPHVTGAKVTGGYIPPEKTALLRPFRESNPLTAGGLSYSSRLTVTVSSSGDRPFEIFSYDIPPENTGIGTGNAIDIPETISTEEWQKIFDVNWDNTITELERKGFYKPEKGDSRVLLSISIAPYLLELLQQELSSHLPASLNSKIRPISLSASYFPLAEFTVKAGEGNLDAVKSAIERMDFGELIGHAAKTSFKLRKGLRFSKHGVLSAPVLFDNTAFFNSFAEKMKNELAGYEFVVSVPRQYLNDVSFARIKDNLSNEELKILLQHLKQLPAADWGSSNATNLHVHSKSDEGIEVLKIHALPEVTAAAGDGVRQRPSPDDTPGGKDFSAEFDEESMADKLAAMGRAKRMEKLMEDARTAPLLSETIDLSTFSGGLVRLANTETNYFKEQKKLGTNIFVLANLPAVLRNDTGNSKRNYLEQAIKNAEDAKVRLIFDYKVDSRKSPREAIAGLMHRGFDGYRLSYEEEPETIKSWLPDLLKETYTDYNDEINPEPIIALPYNGKPGSSDVEELVEKYRLYRLVHLDPDPEQRRETPDNAWLEIDPQRYEEVGDFKNDLEYVMNGTNASVVGMDSSIYAQGEHRLFDGINDFREYFINLFNKRIEKRREDPAFRYDNAREEALQLPLKSLPRINSSQREQLIDLIVNYQALAGLGTAERKQAMAATLNRLGTLLPADASDDAYARLRKLYDKNYNETNQDKLLRNLATAAGFAHGILEQTVDQVTGEDKAIAFASQRHAGMYRRTFVDAEIIVRGNDLTIQTGKSDIYERFYAPLTQELYKKAPDLIRDQKEIYDISDMVKKLDSMAGMDIPPDTKDTVPKINKLYAYARYGKPGSRPVAIAELLKVLELYADKKSIFDPKDIADKTKNMLPAIIGVKGIGAAA